MVNGQHFYGEVQYYLLTKNNGLIYAVIRKIKISHNSLSQLVVLPTDEDLIQAYNACPDCGSYFKAIEFDENLITASVDTFVSKCLILYDTLGQSYLTEILSSFEHN